MPAFAFRFEALLKQRQAAEDVAKKALGQAMSAKTAIEHRLRNLQNDIRQAKQDLGESLVGRVNMQAVGQVARHASFAVFDGHKLVQQLAQAEQRVHQARQAVVEARKQTRALELLKEKDLAEWKKQQARKQAIEMDEIASQRYVRTLQTGHDGGLG